MEELTLRYIELFPEDYKNVCDYLVGEREKNKDKYASVNKDAVTKRKIYEIPEILHNMFVKFLTTEELVAMKDGESGKEVSKWFAKRFPEFAGGEII